MQGIDHKVSLRRGGQGSLNELAGRAQAVYDTLAIGNALLVITVKLLNERVDQTLIKILSRDARPCWSLSPQILSPWR